MKTCIQLTIIPFFGICVFLFLSSLTIQKIDPETLIGAWEYGPENNRTVMIVTDKVFSVATYDLPGKKFISSHGGTWRIDGNKLIEKIEWNSADTSQVGKEVVLDINLSNNQLSVKQNNQLYKRVDNGKPGKLMGAWIITGTYENDQVKKRANPFYPRRTMKILSGTRFQWIAYNVATKQFIHTGGGTYTTKNGTYTENIDFFTKTSESVGKSLSFQYSFVYGDWRHKGEKSTGGVMDECWSRRETLEK